MASDARYINLTFPVPVSLTEQDIRDLHDITSRICKRYEAAHPGRAMWVFGVGSPITSMPITAEDEAAGVPLTFDDHGFEFEVSERADYRWPCARCGKPQGDHAGHILNPPAGDCDFHPACRTPRGIKCDGQWHRGWDGHDPYAERCPNALTTQGDVGSSNPRG